MPKRKSASSDVDRLLAPKHRHVNQEIKLFYYLMKKYGFKTDVQLADFLYTSPSIISQIRNGKIPLSHRLILIIYDKTELSIEDIRKFVREPYEGDLL